MDEYLWPARNVAEYAYCPRLFYLMEVEGVHLPSGDTMEGDRIHRRVDAPSRAKGTPLKAKSSSALESALREKSGDDSTLEQRLFTVRSLTLSSKTLCLTATLDLAQIEGNEAIPVEYRKGRPRSIDSLPADDGWNLTETPPVSTYEPWPTDRIQLTLQTILLEEAGYRVPEGILYYAATKQKLHFKITDIDKTEALETLQLAKDCANGSRPAPLLNDSRCDRCSLYSFCLPDEINFIRAEEQKKKTGTTRSSVPLKQPRSILPAREDGLFLVAQTDGVKIGVRGESVRFSDKDGKVIKEVPLANIEGVALLGKVQISTQAIHALAADGIPVAFLSAVGRPIAFIDPLDAASAMTRTAQILALQDEIRRADLARAVIRAKIENQRTLLMRNHPDLPNSAARELNDIIKAVEQEVSVDALRGHEGYAAKIYFEHFGKLFKSPEGEFFQKNGRVRRPPPDPINATISFGYSMLVHECTAALRLARLDPAIGALHVAKPGRPALALDLMEPFRLLIADSIAVSAFNRHELGSGHFLNTAAGCLMTDYGRRAFFSAYSRRMDTEIRHPVFGYRLSYRRMLSLHAKMIAAWFRGELETLTFLTTR